MAEDAWEFWHELLQSVLTSAFHAGIVRSQDGGMGFIRYVADDPVSGVPIPPLDFARLYNSRPPIGGAPFPPGVALGNDLSRLLGVLHDAGYHGVVFLIDEAHFLVRNPDLMQQLRHVSRSLSRIALVFAGEPPVNQLFTDPAAPFYLQARVIPVGNFQLSREIADCVLLPLREDERPLVSPTTIDHLGRLSQGKPNQIRLLAHSIYRRYARGDQDDLNITTGALDDVLDTIKAQYEAEYDLKERVDSIRRLSSVDLEVLYLVTRYPAWRTEDIIALDEAFRGERRSLRASARRAEQLQAKRKRFVEWRLLEDVPERYALIGGEFVSLYLRFWYELKKYGALISRLDLRQGPRTPFGEKVDKLISSLEWIVGRGAELITFAFVADESPREQLIIRVHQRFAALKSLIDMGPPDVETTRRFISEWLGTCKLIGRSGLYSLLVLAIRSRENPRESILAEVYFEGTEPIIFPADLMRDQVEAAALLIEAIDILPVHIPSPEELVKAVTGGMELEEVLKGLDPFEQWHIRAVRRLVAKSPDNQQGSAAGKPDSKRWIQLYQNGSHMEAVDVITEYLGQKQSRTEQARLYNDRGYIRYGLKEQLELAKQDLRTTLDLHHRSLALTLLNLAVIAIDESDFSAAIDYLNDALLITLGRESLAASFLRLRLLPGSFMVKRERWEQHPANVIEGAYINLGYATAYASGYEAAQAVLEEGRELMPSSARIIHAMARLHLWKHRADRADPLYRELSELPLDNELRHEVQTYLKTGRSRRRSR